MAPPPLLKLPVASASGKTRPFAPTGAGGFVFFYNNFTQLFNVFVVFSDFLESSRVSSLTAFLGVSRFKELMQYLDDYMQRYEDENGGWTT